jgi:hypothetical protein
MKENGQGFLGRTLLTLKSHEGLSKNQILTTNSRGRGRRVPGLVSAILMTVASPEIPCSIFFLVRVQEESPKPESSLGPSSLYQRNRE